MMNDRIGIDMGESIAGKLPQAFKERMETLLGDEYDAFLTSYEQERNYGLRNNPLKKPAGDFTADMPFSLEKVSWAKEGYYYRPEDQPGKDILHELGAYYIQEPSAMAVTEVLDPKPGETILDLCAAPGGKSTQIAGRMNGEGLLVSNEIIPNRAKILSQNIERMGIKNCVVCNETPDSMAAAFPVFFDRILVDAPCSGEGMFRKEESAIDEWSPGHVRMCADRQLMILDSAAGMLKAGGVLVYSTCTFAPEENEGVISRFLEEHAEFAIEQAPHADLFTPGKKDWIGRPAEGIEHTVRLMPHRVKGEGHFIARLRKRGEQQGIGYEEKKDCRVRMKSERRKDGKAEEALQSRVIAFLTEEIGLDREWLARQGGALQLFGEQVYLVPDNMISLNGLKVVRPGLHIGTDKKNRIEPSHALALSLLPEETLRKRVITRAEAEKYIRGEGLICNDEKGWILLVYDGYPAGFGKAVQGQIKNHYPKGLRIF